MDARLLISAKIKISVCLEVFIEALSKRGDLGA